MSPHENDISKQPKATFLRSEHVICMSDLSDDLRQIIDAWESLPKAVKAGIVAMVNVAKGGEQ